VDIGYGPGVFAPPVDDITTGDTAADATPPLDDTEPDLVEFGDMSDVIPAGLKVLQS
jgi:hypothetical protein